MTPSSPLYRTKAGAEFRIPVELDLREDHGKTVNAVLAQVHTGFFQLFSPVFLQSNTMIDIIFDRQRLEVEVVFCKADASQGYSVGTRLIAGLNGEARREPRMPVDMPARITAPDFVSPVSGRLVDISRSGLGLRVPTEILPGSGLVVELHSGIAFGIVKHSSRKAPLKGPVKGKDFWHIGISLEDFISRKQKDSKFLVKEYAAGDATSHSWRQILKRMFGAQ